MNAFVTDPVTLAYHELRSPLALMATLARSAADDCADDALRTRCLSIVRTAERMLRTAGQVMVVAERASRDHHGTFSPGDVVRKLVADYAALDVLVHLDVPGDCLLEVSGAPGQLEALLCSLIGNALDHGNTGEAVCISIRETQQTVIIDVRNRIARARTHRGLGLGSYIGDRLARALNASLDLNRTDDVFAASISIPGEAPTVALAI